MTRFIVVTGSHTDVGKTHVACSLVAAFVRDGARVEVRKPVLSGFDPKDAHESDAARLLRATRAPARSGAIDAAIDDAATDEAAIAAISPWRFPAPIAPDAAARAAGTTLMLAPLVDHARRASDADVVVVETAGGVMSPIAEDGTCLDLVAALAPLGARTVLVVGAYLGGISHGLTAHLALRSRGVDVAAVVVNRATADDAEPFSRFLPQTPVLTCADAPAARDRANVDALVRALAPAR